MMKSHIITKSMLYFALFLFAVTTTKVPRKTKNCLER